MKRTKSFLISSLALTLLLLAACGGQAEPTPQPTAEPVEPTAEPMEAIAEPTAEPVEATAEPTAEPVEPTAEPVETPTEAPEENGSYLDSIEHVPDPLLIGFTWEWVQRDPNGNEIPPITVPNPENYTLLFNENGTFNATIDCNDAAGQYKTPRPGSIFMELGPTTAAACGDDSLDTDMINMFGPAQNYRFEDDGNTLIFSWAAGGPVDYYRNAEAEVPGEAAVRSIPPDAIELNTGALASTYQWVVVPGNPIPPGPGGQGFPPHIVLTFDGQTADEAISENGSIMYIFPINAYMALYNAAGNSSVEDTVIRLQELIDTADIRTTIPESPMPLLPPPSSFMGRWAQYADLNFGVGSGVRYVSEAPNRQGIGPWTNLGTAYYYQGLTSDNRFYISMRWPVSTAALPDTPEDVPEDVLAASTNPDTYPDYLQETITTLNALAPTDWSPSLAALDAMAGSLTFPTDAEGEDISNEEEVSLPDAQTGAATGTVNAPDGVFIRTGPGTEYPSVGAAPFEETGEIVGVSADSLWWVFAVPEAVNAPNNQGWVAAQFIDAQNANDVPVIPAPPQEPALTGTTWGWVSTTDPQGETAVTDPSRYTILFNEDGSANIKADCNNVGASYTVDGGSISIVLGPSTLAACPPDSLDQQFLAGLSSAAVYFFEEGDLFMDMAADAGTMRFTAQTGSDQTPPTPENPAGGAEGTNFNVVSFGAIGAEQAVLEGTSLTALFSQTQVSGSAGCNDYTGTLTPVEDHFIIGPIATTQKLCNDPAGIMEQEQAFLTALEATAGFAWVNDKVGDSTIITSGQLFYTTAENLPGVINLISQ